MLPSTIGPYRIVRQLGEGGMGVVYEGVNDSIERRVAVKVLRPEYAKNKDVTTRFFNEARAVNRIDHPGLVQISDYAQLADGSAYIVMEYLRGESLAARIDRLGGRLALGNALQIAWQIADALVAAHEKSIVHRDLKPDNVMLVADKVAPSGERAKLLDFGIAKLAEAAQTGQIRTSTNMLMGTPRYMAPEQCRGASEVDHKADVYALGVMLYHMLSGRFPFDGDGTGEIIAKHIYEPPAPIKSIAPELPDELAAFVHSLLSKDKEQRPAMSGVFAELGRMLPAHASVALPAPPARPSGTIPIKEWSRNPSTLSESAAQTVQPLLRRTSVRIVVALLAVATLAGTAGVGFGLLRDLPATQHSAAMVPKQEPSVSASKPSVRVVGWSITTTPAGAEVIRERDGAVLGKTPWSTQQEPTPGTEELRLRLAGYEERSVTLQRSGHEQLRETLEPLPPSSAAAGAPTKSPASGKNRSKSVGTKPPLKKKEVRLNHGTVPVPE